MKILGISRTAISRDSTASQAQLHNESGAARENRRTTGEQVFASNVSSNMSEGSGVSPDKSATQKKMMNDELEIKMDCELGPVRKVEEV